MKTSTVNEENKTTNEREKKINSFFEHVMQCIQQK